MDFLTHADLTGRLRGLVIGLGRKITPEQARLADELIDASEFGVALETIAGWLSEEEQPLHADLRSDIRRLARQLGNEAHVMGPLERCPEEPDEPGDPLDPFH